MKTEREIPNCYGDLNAMHEAVMSLPSGLKEHSFRRALAKAVGVAGIDDWEESLVCLDKLTNATAPQRAEAFLRTIGQWEEGEIVSKRLERELTEKTNKVARLRDERNKAEAEIKDIRAALGDDGRRTHREILELASKASKWREWKGKYIDLRNAQIAEGQDPAGTIWEHADKLQKQLTEKTNEVARLREENAELKQGKVFVDPKWIYDLETQLSKAHEELCQAGLREYGV